MVLSNTSAYLGPVPPWDALIETVLRDRDMAAMADMFIGNWFPRDLLNERPDVERHFRAMILATPPEGLAGCFAAVRDADLRSTDAAIAVPTLVIGGVDDTVTLASHSEEIADAVPGARLSLMPGVHMLNVERQASFTMLLTDFLNAGLR